MKSHAHMDSASYFSDMSTSLINASAQEAEQPSTPSSLTARLPSFQTLTSYIPLSWSPRSSSVVVSTAAAAAALCFSSDTPRSSISSMTASRSAPSLDFYHSHVSSPLIRTPPPAVAKQPGFVAKEKQLERLRVRLEEERRMRAQGVTVGHLGSLSSGSVQI